MTTAAMPRLDGELVADQAALAAAADDFGHLVHRTPSFVLRPGSIEDVSRTIEWAQGRGFTVAARGQGHSVYGRSQASGGVVIDMTTRRTIGEVSDDRVAVDAGATWSDVVAATLPSGLTPPVLTDYLPLSVGGTLAVGGVGATTSRHGLQTDNVLELDVVTGAGDVLTCSPNENAELFDSVRAGLGQAAVITRATLRLMPAPTQVRRYLLFYPDLAGMLHDERHLDEDGRFDAVQGAVLFTPQGVKFRLDAVAPVAPGCDADDDTLLAGLADIRSAAEVTTTPYLDYLNRLAALETALRGNGQWHHRHPWLTTFVGDSQVEDVVAHELRVLDPTELGPFGQVVVSAFRRDAVRTPLLQLPDDRRCYAFNFIRIPATDDPAIAARMVASNQDIHDRTLAAGGTLYPVSAFSMTPEDWQQHFGPAWSQVQRAKGRFDPHHVLTPGYELFPRRS